MVHEFQKDIDAVGKIDEVPTIFEVIKLTTGMRFAAVARVTNERWVTCAVVDEIDFGLEPGGEIPIAQTFCTRIHNNHKPVVYDDSLNDPEYSKDELAQSYDFRSYISVPIILPDGSFFGTLCGLDLEPRKVKNDKTVKMFLLFAKLVGHQLYAQKALAETRIDLNNERETSELREQFIAVLGHDLRSPLASVSSGAQLLLRKSEDEKTRQVLSMMAESAQRMGAMVENLLDFARGRLGGGIALSKERVALAPILTQVTEEFRVTYPDRNIELTMEVGEGFNCDRGRMEQVLSNLIGNALTHGAPEMPVKVRATQIAKTLEIAVENGGKPIPQDAIERLFQPFKRAKDHARKDGLGLGLFIAHEIVKAHGGELTVKSDNLATCFTCKIRE